MIIISYSHLRFQQTIDQITPGMRAFVNNIEDYSHNEAVVGNVLISETGNCDS